MANHEIDPPVMSTAVENLYIGQEDVFHHSTEKNVMRLESPNFFLRMNFRIILILPG